MTLQEMKDRVMFQTRNDVDDLDEFEPHLDAYLNDAYDRMAYAWAGAHIGSSEYPPLLSASHEPNLPERLQPALADWATWLVYRNGNPQKQQRGMPFMNAFFETIGRIYAEGRGNGKRDTFINVFP